MFCVITRYHLVNQLKPCFEEAQNTDFKSLKSENLKNGT